MSSRGKIEQAARDIAVAAKALKPEGSAFCVLIWGPDENGQQWRTYVHDVAPMGGSDSRHDCRLALARELRDAADMIESRSDVPPGVMGRG